jgi:hypothetical protein
MPIWTVHVVTKKLVKLKKPKRITEDKEVKERHAGV